MPTPEEALLLSHREKAIKYFTTPMALFPSEILLHFPALQITLHHRGRSIVYGFSTFLQNKERQDINEEYFQTKLNIHPSSLPHLDRYTLRRVLQSTPSHRHTYSKIIHLQLNTMTVNHRWAPALHQIAQCAPNVLRHGNTPSHVNTLT